MPGSKVSNRSKSRSPSGSRGSLSPVKEAEVPQNEGKKKKAVKKRATTSTGTEKKTTLTLCTEAISTLKGTKGASAAAIRKYVAAHSSAQGAKLNFMVRKALATGVKKGVLSQPKGSSASLSSGRFKVGKKSPKRKKSRKSKKKTPKKKKSKKGKKKAKKSPKKKRKAKKAKKSKAKKRKSPKKRRKSPKKRKAGKSKKRKSPKKKAKRKSKK